MTFYGIYMNCQLAAYAFRVAVERISQMAAEHKPAPGSSVSTKSSRLSYALGMERGIADAVDTNIEQEKKRRERKLERARRAASSGEAYEESDDDKDDEDDGSNSGDGLGFSFPSTPPGNEGAATVSAPIAKGRDNNNEIDDNEPHESAGSKDSKLSGDNLSQRLTEMEKEEQTALVLVNHQEKVAKDVLKKKGIKVYAGSKRKRIDWDHASYEKGILDSKEIDLNQRAIKDDWTKKVKKEEK